MKLKNLLKGKKVDLYKVNPTLEKQLKKLVKKIIKEDARKEALEILLKSDEKTLKDFIFFALSDNGNLACMSIDFAKDKDGKEISGEFFGREPLFE